LNIELFSASKRSKLIFILAPDVSGMTAIEVTDYNGNGTFLKLQFIIQACFLLFITDVSSSGWIVTQTETGTRRSNWLPHSQLDRHV
jgi:hypothetical protein